MYYILALYQVIGQFSNFLNFTDDEDQKRLVGLRRAAPQASEGN